jgi:2-polyprenyl-3-methyl-5-hydroxy-6-metoxy-1,4-benzoquinol methylase
MQLEESDLENVACPSCDGKNAEPWLQARSARASKAATTWHLQRCASCNLIFLNPRPTEKASAAFYDQAEYLPFSSAGNQKNLIARVYELARRYNLKWKRRTVSKILRNGRLLDVGCGTGEFLHEMRKAGWEVAGIERDPEAARYARETLQLNVLTGGIEALASINEKFEVITLWHVLEHLYRPKGALQNILSRLNENGVVIIAVPNVGGFDAKFYGNNWVALDAPRHVQHFTLETLQALAAQAGLKMLRCHQLPLDAFFNALISEKVRASISKASFLFWPLRLLRSFLIASASLIAGSKQFYSGKHGATIVAYFTKLGS